MIYELTYYHNVKQVHVVPFVKLHVFTLLVPFCDIWFNIRLKRLYCHLFMEFIYLLFMFIYTYDGVRLIRWCSCRLPTIAWRVTLVGFVLFNLLFLCSGLSTIFFCLFPPFLFGDCIVCYIGFGVLFNLHFCLIIDSSRVRECTLKRRIDNMMVE